MPGLYRVHGDNKINGAHAELVNYGYNSASALASVGYLN